MKILLFGVSNVGKSTVGKLLAERLGVTFYDLDEEIKIKQNIGGEGTMSIELIDTADNIFSRLVFSDEQDRVYNDDIYKNKHKDYYMQEIQADLNWYGKINSDIGIKNHMFINNDMPEKVVDRIINEFGIYK